MQILLNVISDPFFFVPAALIVGGGIIYKIAIPLIQKLGRKIRDSALYINLKSLFCYQCAHRHELHTKVFLVANKLSSANLTETNPIVFSGQ